MYDESISYNQKVYSSESLLLNSIVVILYIRNKKYYDNT